MTDAPTMPAAGQLTRLGRSSRSTLLGSVVSAALGFPTLVVLTNAFGADDAGIVLIAVAVANIAIGAALLGTDAALVRFVAAAERAGHHREMARLTLIGVIPVVVVSLAIAVVGWIGVETIADWVVDGPVESSHVDSLRIALLSVPMGAVGLSLLAATRGAGSMAPTVWLDQIQRPVLQILVLAVVAASGASVSAATAAWLWPFAVPLVGAAIWLSGRAQRSTGSTSAVSIATFWRFALPQAGTGLLRVLVRWVDTLVVGALLGVGPAAVYTAATRLLKLGSIVNQAVFRAAAPQIAEELSVGDREAAGHLYRTSANWLVLATWPLYLGCLVYAPIVLRVFGDGFDDGATAVRILAGAMLVASACGPVESVLVMSGRSAVNLANNVAALVANVGLGLLLIPPLGIEGAALAWAVSVGFTNVAPLVQVWRHLGLSPLDRVMVRTAMSFAAAFGSAGLIVAILGENSSGIVASLAIVSIGVAVTLWFQRDELALRELLAGR